MKQPFLFCTAIHSSWEGNLLLIICFIAGLLDVRKRRFLVKPITADNNGLTEKPEPIEPIKPKTEMPKILKAFQKPEFSNKGAAFSNEFSTKPGEKPRFLNDEEKTSEKATNKTTEV